HFFHRQAGLEGHLVLRELARGRLVNHHLHLNFLSGGANGRDAVVGKNLCGGDVPCQRNRQAGCEVPGSHTRKIASMRRATASGSAKLNNRLFLIEKSHPETEWLFPVKCVL